MSTHKNDHVICIGVSPFNSRFSTEYISQLIQESQKSADHIGIFYPGDSTIHSLMAKGYDLATAKKKLSKQSRYCINKIKTAIANTSELRNCSIEIIDGVTDYKKDVNYQACADFVRNTLKSNNLIRFEFEKFARSFLNESLPTQFQLESIREYVVDEAPFIINGENLFDARNYKFYYENSPSIFHLLKDAWENANSAEKNSIKIGNL